MEKKETDLKVFAAKQLAAIYDVQDYAFILQNLKEKDFAFRNIQPAIFGVEYLSSRLALACHAWARICDENKIQDSNFKNMFFKAVMQSFQSPKVVDIASSFSEYLHVPMAEQKSVFAVSAMLMKRLGLAGTMSKGEQAVLPQGFRILMEAGEGFKNSFENELFEFLNF